MWAGPALVCVLITVTAAVGPNLEFLAEPVSKLVKSSDGRAVFRCSASPPTAEIRWLFRGQPVTHSRWIKVMGHKLTVHLGRMESRAPHQFENGYFQCEARLKGKALVSTPAKLIMAVLDEFPAQPDVHIAAIHGNTAVIPCDPPYSVPTVVTEFNFNGTLIDRSRENKVLMPSGDLQILHVKPEDSGEYVCIANNPFLNERVQAKRKVMLHVNEPNEAKAPTFVKSPRARLATTLGSNITLECIASGFPIPVITWRRHHGKLPHSRYQQVGGNLLIFGIRRGDEGLYYCEAENSLSSISTSTAIEVQETPQIVKPLKSMSVELGKNLSLSCVTRGHPKPSIKWMHNGHALSSDSETVVKGSHLVVHNVNMKHSGIYQCFASTHLATVYSYALITVKSANKSIDLDYPTEDYDDYDDDANSASFHRDKKKDFIPKGQNSDDNIKNSDKGITDFDSDSIAKRPHKKKGSKGVKLIPPSRPEVTRLSDTSVMVRWGVPRNDGLPILFFKVQYREVGRRNSHWMTIDEDIAAHIHSYAVTNLRTGGKYRFRIAAVYSNNDNKLGPNSAKFVLYKDPPMKKPSSGPLITHAEAASPSAITLHWEYDDVDSIPIEGFFIYYRATHTAGDYLKVTVLGANTRSHIISHLLPDTGYDMKMQCFNIAGTSEFSNIYTCKTKPSEIIAGSRSRNSKSHQPDEMPFSDTEPVSSKNSDGNFVLYIVLGVVSGVLLIAVSVFLTLYIRQKQNRPPPSDDESVRQNSVKLNGHATSNGYIPVSDKMNISVNPMSHLEMDDSDKPDDFEETISNNNEIIRLQTFSMNGVPPQEALLTSEIDENQVNDDNAVAVISPSECDSNIVPSPAEL